MKQIIFNKSDYKSYKDFYHDVCIKLDKDRFIDWNGEYEDLGYSANLLNEFLWYCDDDNVDYIFIGFDLDKINKQKTYEDYKYSLALDVFCCFAKEYPNNKVEFRDK